MVLCLDISLCSHFQNVNHNARFFKTVKNVTNRPPEHMTTTPFLPVDLENARGYLSTVRGTGTCHFLGVLFSNHYGIMGIIFTIF